MLVQQPTTEQPTAAQRRAVDDLLSARDGRGVWTGQLSTSALATATAISALSLSYKRESPEYKTYVAPAIEWLMAEQNPDGGWGDTPLSDSNIATTMLVQAALALAAGEDRFAEPLERAASYVNAQGGRDGVRERYGRDKTFAVPILANAALAGQVPWNAVSSLPFELACLPQSWYRFLQLPVVSYAIPALVAVGQAIHHARKPRNPLTRWLRNLAIAPSLRVLARIQPASGGYLEAIPLTSFVAMSLASCGRADHPVTKKCLEFIKNSMRADASWPIDTNLATWNTTLALNALGGPNKIELTPGEHTAVIEWVLTCQNTTPHPFTGAAPGGWGWSDLTGAVPDADDTPGALLALRNYCDSPDRDVSVAQAAVVAAARGVRWLLDIQNRDGGWPTFCRGWGKLPFDRSGTDLTAHALRALHAWRDVAPQEIELAAARGWSYLAQYQNPDGSWTPLWFGNQHHPAEENPIYGTSKCLLAYQVCGRMDKQPAQAALGWLAGEQNDDDGWGGDGSTSSVEETALATEAVIAAASDSLGRELAESAWRGVNWLISAVEDDQHRRAPRSASTSLSCGTTNRRTRWCLRRPRCEQRRPNCCRRTTITVSSAPCRPHRVGRGAQLGERDLNLATADVTTGSDAVQQQATSAAAKPRRSRRRQTAHLKLVPESKQLRVDLRQRCADVAAQLDKSNPLTKDEMESVARALLDEAGLPEGYVGWAMVALASEFYKAHVAATPPSRRLFLLPHCLKHAEGCPADYDEFGLDCERCGACSIADFRTTAEEMGYKVLVAEGSPIVLKIVVSGHVDAIVGVACLNVLEKAIDKILLAGIPCMAVPLLSSDCRNTSVDEDWVQEMIHVQADSPKPETRSYVHLMRTAKQMFAPAELNQLVPRARGEEDCDRAVNGNPLAATEAIAYDFLAKGGKYSRPFITLSVYDALTGGQATRTDGAAHLETLSDQVKRTALAIETFHKASLVHDDIEDDDAFRYGDETIHHRYGIPTAINVGDYLIGLGYRLASMTGDGDAASTVDIVRCLADAHTKLSEGQGAELLWRDAHDKRLTPLDALKIYALKTAPAFEAALMSGARLAGSINDYAAPITQFARNLGVGFQILNDLKDWSQDCDNKLKAGADVLGGRPTLLLALALDSLDDAKQQQLLGLIADDERADQFRIDQVRQLFQEGNVFEKAERLVDKHQDRAEAIADEVQPDDLRRLMYYLVDTVLDRPQNSISASDLILPTMSAS